MKIVICAAIIAVFLQGCGSPQQQLPKFKITEHKEVALPTGGAKIIVGGIGATPDGNVAISLEGVTGDVTIPGVQIGTVKANNLGVFQLSTIQGCVFQRGRAPSSAHFQVHDLSAQSTANSDAVQTGILICP